VRALYFALLWLGNFKTSGCLVGRLTCAPHDQLTNWHCIQPRTLHWFPTSAPTRVIRNTYTSCTRINTRFPHIFKNYFPYFFNSKYKDFNTITFTYLHFSKILFQEHNSKNIYKIVISSKEKNLNKKWEKSEFPYFFNTLCRF